MFVLAQSLILVIGLVFVGIHDAAGMLLTLYLLVTLIPSLAATVRRLHDAGRGVWWLPLGVVLAPLAFVLGAMGVQFMEVGFLGRVFASLVDEQGAAEELSDLFELGVALFGLGVMTGIAAGAWCCAVWAGGDDGHRSWSAGDYPIGVLGISKHKGREQYGPHPE